MKFRYLCQWRNCRTRQFVSENFEMNVVYNSQACALNSFSSGVFYAITFVTFLLSLNANNLINLFFVSIYKCVTVITFHAQIFTKKSVEMK